MIKRKSTSLSIWLLLLLLVLISSRIYAAGYSEVITEEYLRSHFTFAAGDKLKYSECKKKTHPTCTYIWGPESKKDATRIKHGLTPAGNKLQIITAQAGSANDFQRVLATYSDAEKIEGIGNEAAWSNKRKQLSFITDSNLIFHINIDDKGTKDLKARAISIGHDIYR